MVDFFWGGTILYIYIYINRRFCRCSCAHDDPHLLPFQSYRCLYLVHWLLHSPLFGVFCWCNFSFSFHVSFGQFGVGLVGEWVGARTSLHWRTLFDTTLKKISWYFHTIISFALAHQHHDSWCLILFLLRFEVGPGLVGRCVGPIPSSHLHSHAMLRHVSKILLHFGCVKHFTSCCVTRTSFALPSQFEAALL